MKKKQILIATKTYPAISRKYRETVCTAGVLLDENEVPLQWIRVYPVRFRYLDFDKKFPRWSIISAEIEKNPKDNRVESYRINDNSISVLRKLSTRDAWADIKQYVLPFEFKSINEIQELGKSLGIIKPRNVEYSFFKETEREWSQSQRAALDQMDLFEPSMDLEKIPYQFGYKFYDGDGIPHKYTILDWEISQLYRNCRDSSKQKNLANREKEAVQKVIQKLDLFKDEKDLYFIVGNLQRHQKSFLIIGIFYPPKIGSQQLKLF